MSYTPKLTVTVLTSIVNERVKYEFDFRETGFYIMVFWVVTLCSLVGGSKYFGRTVPIS